MESTTPQNPADTLSEQNSPVESPPQTTPPKSSSKLFVVIAVMIVALLVFLLVGFFVLNSYIRLKELEPNNTAANTPSKSLENEPGFSSGQSTTVAIAIPQLNQASGSAVNQPTITPAPQQIEPTKSDPLPEGYGAIIYELDIPPGIPSQLTFNISAEDLGEKRSITVINPKNEVVDIPIFDWDVEGEVDKEVARELTRRSVISKIGASAYVFKFFPDDPDLSPINGLWKIKVVGKGNQRIVDGVVVL